MNVNSQMATANQDREELVADGLVSVEEAAGFLGVARTKIYDLMKEGKLPFVKFEKLRRLPKRALRQYASRHLVLSEDDGHPYAG